MLLTYVDESPRRPFAELLGLVRKRHLHHSGDVPWRGLNPDRMRRDQLHMEHHRGDQNLSENNKFTLIILRQKYRAVAITLTSPHNITNLHRILLSGIIIFRGLSTVQVNIVNNIFLFLFYFIFAYAILRSTPQKLGGVIDLALSIAIISITVIIKILSTSPSGGTSGLESRI